MSSHAATHPDMPASADTSHAEGKFHMFVEIAMILAVITGVEIIAVYVPIARWVLFSLLVVLSIVKFMMVIFYFMHLRWDKVFCTILFFIGLILAGGTMAALLHIFAADASHPVGAAYEAAG